MTIQHVKIYGMTLKQFGWNLIALYTDVRNVFKINYLSFLLIKKLIVSNKKKLDPLRKYKSFYVFPGKLNHKHNIVVRIFSP